MIEKLTPLFRFTCDRCGKEISCDDKNFYYYVSFVGDDNKIGIGGDVCDECRKDFCEIAENFFNDVNRERR